MDLPDSDWGDFSCRRAVDSSSFFCYVTKKNIIKSLQVKICSKKIKQSSDIVMNRLQMGTSGRYSLWRVKIDFIMMTSSNGNIFRVTGPLCGDFTGHRWIPLTKAGDVELRCFFDLHLNKRLSKQSWGWWSETPPRSLWRHCNHAAIYLRSICNITVFDLIDSGNIFTVAGIILCMYPAMRDDVTL